MPTVPTSTPRESAPSVFGPTLVITGTVNAEEDLEVHATIRGTVSAPAHCVHVGLEARIEAEVLARDITVLGQAAGRLTATEIVDVRASARVQGHIASPRLVLAEGGQVNARVETRSVDAAVRVAQYRKQR